MSCARERFGCGSRTCARATEAGRWGIDLGGGQVAEPVRLRSTALKKGRRDQMDRMARARCGPRGRAAHLAGVVSGDTGAVNGRLGASCVSRALR